MAKTPFSRFGNQPPPIPQMPKVALDKVGRIIEAGHLVNYIAPTGVVLEVIGVAPVVHPGAGSGRAMQITVQGQFNIYDASPGRGNQYLIVVGESQARMQAHAAGNGKVDIGPSSQADGHAEPPSEGPKLILTDALDAPGDQPIDEPTQDEQDAFDRSQPEAGTCPACGDTGRAGTACIDCGAGIYQA